MLGVLLAGIVAAQVEILKLGASTGRALEQTTTLSTQNEALRGSVAQLSDDQRIERLAGSMGLVLPPPGAVGYLAATTGGDVARALQNIHAPNPAAFVMMSAKNGGMVTGPGTSTLPPPPGTPAPPPPASTATSGNASPSTATSTPSTASSTASTATPTAPASATSTSQATPTSQSTTAPVQTTATTSQASTPQSSSAGTSSQGTQPAGAPATGAAAVGPSQASSGG